MFTPSLMHFPGRADVLLYEKGAIMLSELCHLGEGCEEGGNVV